MGHVAYLHGTCGCRPVRFEFCWKRSASHCQKWHIHRHLRYKRSQVTILQQLYWKMMLYWMMLTDTGEFKLWTLVAEFSLKMTHSVGVRQQQQSLSLWTTMPCWQAKAPGAPISEWWKRGVYFLFEGQRYFCIMARDPLTNWYNIDIPFCPSTGYLAFIFVYI